MAGDWIPMRTALADDPAVIVMAGMTGLDEYSVVGRLHRLWSWANTHLEDGNASSVTESWVDRYLGVTGFASAMVSVGWLVPSPAGLIFPKFERWNASGAKKRLATNKRVTDHRMKRTCNASGNASSVTESVTREEKRREEKREDKNPPTPQGFEEFYAAYPRKVGRPAAERVFTKLSPSPGLLALILAAIARQRTWPQWTKDDGQFIPHPATWLNQRRWEDEPPSATGPPPPRHGGLFRTRTDEILADIDVD